MLLESSLSGSKSPKEVQNNQTNREGDKPCDSKLIFC